MLTGLMVLLFLRDWRSALDRRPEHSAGAAGAVLALWLTGQTINIMTLGGLALAVGILVDEATVDDREHPHASCDGAVARPAPSSEATAETARAAVAGDALRAGGFHSRVLHDGRGARRCSCRCRWRSAFRWWRRICFRARSCRCCRCGCCAQAPARADTAQETFCDRLQARYDRGSQRVVMRRRRMVVRSRICDRCCGRDHFRWSRGSLGTEIFPRVDAGPVPTAIARARRDTRIERTEAIALQTSRPHQGEVGRTTSRSRLGFVGVQPPNYPINYDLSVDGGPEEGVLQVQLKRGAGSASRN